MNNYYVIPNFDRPDMDGKWLVICRKPNGFTFIHDAYKTKKQALAVARDYNTLAPYEQETV